MGHSQVRTGQDGALPTGAEGAVPRFELVDRWSDRQIVNMAVYREQYIDISRGTNKAEGAQGPTARHQEGGATTPASQCTGKKAVGLEVGGAGPRRFCTFATRKLADLSF